MCLITLQVSVKHFGILCKEMLTLSHDSCFSVVFSHKICGIGSTIFKEKHEMFVGILIC